MNEYELLWAVGSLEITIEINKWAAKGWKLHTFQVIGETDIVNNRRFYAVMEKECENESS